MNSVEEVIIKIKAREITRPVTPEIVISSSVVVLQEIRGPPNQYFGFLHLAQDQYQRTQAKSNLECFASAHRTSRRSRYTSRNQLCKFFFLPLSYPGYLLCSNFIKYHAIKYIFFHLHELILLSNLLFCTRKHLTNNAAE